MKEMRCKVWVKESAVETLECMLFFADDIALMANNRKDLEVMLNRVSTYSQLWRIKFNLDKCNVVVFNCNQKILEIGNCVNKCTCNHHYKFGPALIKESLLYKYLGIELTNKLSYKVFKARLLSKAQASMRSIWYMGMKDNLL